MPRWDSDPERVVTDECGALILLAHHGTDCFCLPSQNLRTWLGTLLTDSADSLSHATSILFYLNFKLGTADCKDQQDSGLDVRTALPKGNPNAIKQQVICQRSQSSPLGQGTTTGSNVGCYRVRYLSVGWLNVFVAIDVADSEDASFIVEGKG